MCWLCAPCLHSLARSCWGHSEFRRPTTTPNNNTGLDPGTVTAPESELSGASILWEGLCRDDARRGVHIIVKYRCEPALALSGGPTFATCVVLNLVALDLADAEIGALRMAEIKPAHSRARPHCETFGQLDADALALEQIEQRAFLCVIGLRRIAGCRTDAAIFLGD